MLRAPWPLWLDTAIEFVALVVIMATGGFDKAGSPGIAFFVVFYVVVSWFLLRGNKVVWVLLVGFGVIDLLSAPSLDHRWWSVALNLIGLVLLLAPSSFEYVWGQKPTLPWSGWKIPWSGRKK